MKCILALTTALPGVHHILEGLAAKSLFREVQSAGLSVRGTQHMGSVHLGWYPGVLMADESGPSFP